jgi:alkanesulfonate monooxygenase SsuD/methylene tetrahydromethanopterin reductase-like flavin-dependent oxidoreductase (luciferase family)
MGNTVRVGIAIPLTADVPSVGRLLDELTEEVMAAEAAGLDLVMVPEHHQGPTIGYASPLTVATLLAAQTQTIKIATGVLVLPAYHPLHVAEAVTMLDHISGGRFVLGVGAGYQPVDLEPFGVALPTRAAAMEESLEALRLLLTKDVAAYAGQYVAFGRVRLRPRPLTQPAPAVWLGSWSPAGVRRAARLCGGWIADPIRTVTEAAGMAAAYRSAACDAGTSPGTVVVMREAWLDDSDAAARRNFAAVIEPVFDYYRRRGAGARAHNSFDELAADRFVLGDADQCAAMVWEVSRRTGADVVTLHLRHPGGPSHSETLARIRALGEALSRGPGHRSNNLADERQRS